MLPGFSLLMGIFYLVPGQAGANSVRLSIEPRWVNAFSTGTASPVAFSSDGKRVAVAGGPNALKVFNSEDWSEKRTLASELRSPAISLAFSPDTHLLAAGFAERDQGEPTLRVWDQDTGKLTFALDCKVDHVNCVAFSPNGKALAIGANDGSITLFDATQWKKASTFAKVNRPLVGITYSRTGKFFAALEDEGHISVWEVASGKRVASLAGHDGAGPRLAFSNDESLFTAVISWRESNEAIPRAKLVVYDTDTWKVKGELRGHTYGISAFTFHPRQDAIVSVGHGRGVYELRCWDARNLRERFVVQYKARRFTSCNYLAFSPDGKVLLAGSTWQDICRWNWDEIIKEIHQAGKK
jgi:dipeptidyl aminopeptidase/acylaminoacyl peptidase